MMDSATMEHERAQFYLYSVLRLLPLREPGVRLAALPADSAGSPGFRAQRPGWPAVEIYLGRDGRPARLRNAVVEPGTGRTVAQDMWLEGAMVADGVRGPARYRLTWDGRPYFDVTLTGLEARPSLGETLTPPSP
jgi:hypothetical protein